MNAVENFAAEAERFAQWIRHGTDTGEIAAREGLLRLTRLYLAALELPAAGCTNAADEDASLKVEASDRQAVFENAMRLPVNFYGEVFDPLPVPPEEAITASLADDIADIYGDVATGLLYYRAGKREAAVWKWTFNLQIHWGEHITGAIRALHCWLATNAPSRLSSTSQAAT